MTKRKYKRPVNIYSLGSFLGITDELGNITKGAGGIANGIASSLNTIMNPNGNSTGVGDIMSTIGSMASNIPGVGGLIGAGVNLLGGITNSLWGSNLNEGFINQTESNIRSQQGFTSKARDNASLLSDWSSFSRMAHVNKDDVGSEGLFSNAATDKTNELNNSIDKANLVAMQNLVRAGENVDRTNDAIALANFKKDGGGIHIKPENRGKFTRLKERTGKSASWFKAHGTPAQKKMATFALNARKWKHADGGGLYNDRETFTSDLYRTYMNHLINDNIDPIQADKIASYMTMQSALESGYGTSNASKYYNYAGLLNGGEGNEPIRFNSLSEFSDYHYNNLKSKWPDFYKATDLNSYYDLLHTGKYKYSIDPREEYVNKLNGVKDRVNNYLNGNSYRTFLLDPTAKYTTPVFNQPKETWKGMEEFNKFMNEYSNGGFLDNIHGGIFSNGITKINEGGSHEDNPQEGVQIGIDEEGIPNLVEEGEVIYNDYVFSNRLKVPKDVKNKYKLTGNTFADTAKKAQKESEERPNDPISKNGLDDIMSKLAVAQESIREKNEMRKNKKYAKGGKLGNLFVTGGYSYGENPLNFDSNTDTTPLYTSGSDYMRKRNYILNNWDNPFVQHWIDTKYIPFVEDYNKSRGYTTPFTVTKDEFSKGTYDGDYGGMHRGVENFDIPIEQPTVNPLSNIQEYISNPVVPALATPEIKSINNKFGNFHSTEYEDDGMTPDYLRYIPAITNGVSVLSDIFSQPNFDAANRVDSVPIRPNLVHSNPIGNYLEYNPFDRLFYINQLNSNSAAARRAIQNTSGGNRAAAMAGILANNSNYGNQLGTLARQAEEFNNQLEQSVEQFNRATDMFNSEDSRQAQVYNAGARDRATSLRLDQAMKVAALRQAAQDAYDTRRSNNLNNFITSLANIGTENTHGDWLDELARRGVLLLDTRGRYTGSNTKKNGGKIKKNRRKTYA